MRGFYANRENLHKYAELRPTDEELKRFSAEHPDMGEKLEKCRIEKEYLSKFYFLYGITLCFLPQASSTITEGTVFLF